MLNPDRAEFESKSVPAPKTSKKMDIFPRWSKMPVAAVRTLLTILTVVPGYGITADAINRTGYFSSLNGFIQNVPIGPQYNPDLLLTPTPVVTAQSPIVQNVKVCVYPLGGTYYEVCTKYDPDQDFNRPLDRNSDTGINLKAGQKVEISASGRLFPGRLGWQMKAAGLPQGRLSGEIGKLPTKYLDQVKSCGGAYWEYNEYAEFDPDGYRYWGDMVCPPLFVGRYDSKFPDGSLRGYIRNDSGFRREKESFLIGKQWKGVVDRDGKLEFHIESTEGGAASWGHKARGWYDISVTTYPEQNTPPTPVVATPISSRKVEPAKSSTPSPSVTSNETSVPSTSIKDNQNLSIWLLGLGVGFLVGLASYWGYGKWRDRNKFTKPGSTQPGGRSGVGAKSNIPFGIRGGIAGTLGRGSNPNTAPNFGKTQPKNPEWIMGQQEFEKGWQDAKSKLSPVRPGDTGNEPEYILDRFKVGMGIVHEVSLNSRTNVPLMAVRVRAGIEYLIPQIWPDNRVLKRFFDPSFNAGYLNSEDLAKIVYLSENSRILTTFSNQQKQDIRRIRRILMFALHPDTAKADADKNLQESIDDLLKRFNPAWSYIENLIK